MPENNKERTLLKSIRIDNGLNQEELAEILDTTQQNISLIENGKRDPSIRLAKKFEILYQKSMEKLFPDIFSGLETTKCNVNKPA
ncbi:MAG: hypothetical protein AWU54_1635 [Candidatus Frackibacter sp. T328-2]|nr:MAG: hypothetical protein AWU54_1635 [Candidatus Frackibacter sp. T328-2]